MFQREQWHVQIMRFGPNSGPSSGPSERAYCTNCGMYQHIPFTDVELAPVETQGKHLRFSSEEAGKLPKGFLEAAIEHAQQSEGAD